MAKKKYYCTKEIDKTKCLFRLIYGKRSSGKSTDVITTAIKKYFKTGEQFAYLRRFTEETRAKTVEKIFETHIQGKIIDPRNNEVVDIQKLSNYRFNDITCRSGAFYFCKRELLENGNIKTQLDDKPFGFVFCLSKAQSYKGLQYPGVTTICFDEFISESIYLPNEFNSFMSIISTITRDRRNCVIYMLGNTVDTDCPYFRDFRITKYQKNMHIGDIVAVRDENDKDKTTFAIEWTENIEEKGKVTNIYANFDSPINDMINTGVWQINSYPHLNKSSGAIYNPKFSFYVEYYEDLLQGDVIYEDRAYFVYVHKKTTPLKYNKKDIIYSTEFDIRPMVNNCFFRPRREVEKKILELYKANQFCYQDNEIGDMFNNFIQIMKKNII